MVRVTDWPQLLLVVLILRQSAAVSDQCSELQEERSSLRQDILRVRDVRDKAELRANIAEEHLRRQILISQATSNELNKTDALNNYLKKELEVNEEVLKTINEKQTQLQATIDVLTNTVKSLNQTLHLWCGTSDDVCRSLLEAAKSGDVDRTKRLVKCDSNDNCTDDDVYRHKPLTYAARYGHVEVVRVLLEGGANVDRTDVDGRTALHVAAFSGHLDVCRLLLDRGAKVDRLNNWQNTPLLNAARGGHLSVVKLLVERGADVSVKDGVGRKASKIARNNGKKDVADWLDSLSRG